MTPKLSPTEEQSEAIDRITDWLSEPYNPLNWCFTVKGSAGTGKSFTITELLTRGVLKPDKTVFTAPTNKAVKVLREYLVSQDLTDADSCTIFSLLNLSLQPSGEVKTLSKPVRPADLSCYKAVIIDEASMVNSFLFEEIEIASKQYKVPIIFLGDPAQLPPIGELHSRTMNIENSFTLTKVMRYGNALLDLATKIRSVVDNPFPAISISTNPPVYKLSSRDWREKILDNLELLVDGSAKIISWRNIKVAEYNQLIREHHFGKIESRQSPWLIGDKIIAKAPILNLDNETIMHTAEEATIEFETILPHPLKPEFEVHRIKARHEEGYPVDIFSPTRSGKLSLSEQLNRLSMEAKSGKGYLWRQYWALKDTFHEISHAYAITSHSSQGSSYLKSFVDLNDIMLNQNRQEAFRSLYVACTRQREELWIC